MYVGLTLTLTLCFLRQTSSSTATVPNYGFGSTERHHLDKVYISEEHSRISLCPGAYFIYVYNRRQWAATCHPRNKETQP